MLADIKRELSNALGILDKTRRRGAARHLHRRSGRHHPLRFGQRPVKVGRNPQEVLRVLDALQTDELCPCNWQKGQDVLKAA